VPPPLPMTPGRRAALVLGVPIALAIIGLIAVDMVANVGQASLRVDRTVPVRGHQAGLSVDNPDVTLRAAAGSGDAIRVTGTLRGPFVPPVFGLRPTATGLVIRSHCVVPIGSCSGVLAVTVPAGLPVTASALSGDLDASGFRGHVTLSDITGDLGAGRLSGTISLDDGSGDITASSLDGGIRLNDGSGDITVSGLAGDRVSLSDGSGDIDVTGLAATGVTGRDNSGDITLTFTKVPRRVDISVGSGDIVLVLPRGPAYYQVDASSSSGGSTVSVKTRPSSPNVITAIDNSGDVSISYG